MAGHSLECGSLLPPSYAQACLRRVARSKLRRQASFAVREDYFNHAGYASIRHSVEKEDLCKFQNILHQSTAFGSKIAD
jgi:hypothetical protein